MDLLSIIILTLCCAFYLFVHLGLVVGLSRLKYTASNNQPFVSVIVAARNEEENIVNLLECLIHQSYPRYEIILINDRSTDGTVERAKSFSSRFKNLKIIGIKETSQNMPAKKNALMVGITEANGEILCFTDADCFPPKNWLTALVSAFSPEVGLVAGFSPYSIPKADRIMTKLLFEFIAYEEFRGAIWAGGSIGVNLGWLCTGRNLAYRKSVFNEVSGYEQIKHSISGDDDLFLQTVRYNTKWHIRYLLEPDHAVPTLPPMTFKRFFEQRKRHFSAAIYYPLSAKLFFAMYHSSNLLLFLSPLFCFVWPQYFLFFIGTFLCKFLSDTVLIVRSSKIFQLTQYRKNYLALEILYIMYNTFIGPLGLLLKFEWKSIQ